MKNTTGFGHAPGSSARALDPLTATRHPFLMWTFQVIAALGLLLGLASSATASAHDDTKADIPENLTPPAGATLLFELDARGVQIYTCEEDPDDASAFVWTFVAPEAELLNKHGELVGTHFAGPTWQGNDGSAVMAEVLERADAPDAGAIPWLLLGATDHAGSGAFSTITHIQRLATAGGTAPTDGCDADHAGEETRVPYEAVYAFFYAAAPMDAATPSS